mgnify:FL=1|nr:MAG TPA: hypothetical protein [Caudoviricetes sp.]
MGFKLKDGSGVEHTYDQTKLKIPSTTEGETVVFTEGEAQAEKTVDIDANGAFTVEPDAGHSFMKKVRGTVAVPAPVTSVNGATGDVKTNWYCSATYSTNNDSVTMDKTVAEISAAYYAGYNVMCKYIDDTLSGGGTIPLITVSGESTCIFSATGAENALAIPTAPITRTIYYDSASSSWKYTASAAQQSYAVILQEKNGVLTANKTYNDIRSEYIRQYMSGGGISIQILDTKTPALLQIASTSEANKMVFQGTIQLNGKPALVSDEVDANNIWTSTTTPLGNFVVTLTQNENNNYVADKTFEQISAAYNLGQNITLTYIGMKGDLLEISDSSAVFVIDAISVILAVTIQSDNTIEVEQIPVVPLIVTLTKSGDTYSGDSTFADIMNTFDMGQTAQVDYSGTRLYLATQTDTQLLFTGLIVSGDGVTATCATVQSDDTWTYREVIIKEPTSGS